VSLRAWSASRFAVRLPEGHRFPSSKYPLVREAVAAVIGESAFAEPDPIDRASLARVHDDAWIDAVLEGKLAPSEERRLGLPWSDTLRERSLRSVAGTLAAARDALSSAGNGIGLHLGGGTHHAFAGFGEGFCVFNDVAVTLRALQHERAIDRAVVIDLDVHQGNGTARIFAGDPRVFTFSIHGEKNFPFRKEPSRLDVGLHDGCEDDAYLRALDDALDRVLDEARADLAVYLAGADPYVHDRFGRLALTMDGLAARDGRVLDACRARRLPLVTTTAGGYAKDPNDVARIHARMVQGIVDVFGA
jgi:acetoin utilization deacetylase AcuC-like enzyme